MLSQGGKVNDFARNLLCPCYSVCLSSAVKNNSTGFSCADCIRQRTEEPIPVEEPMRCAALLSTVFYPTNVKIRATCPRCAVTYMRYSCDCGSPRRLCPICKTYAESNLSDYAPSYELRALPSFWMQVAPKIYDETT